jgi:glycosyltransferase involved in cell wall biosynthesis
MNQTEKKYSFSIVIPCLNEEDIIAQCLDSILKQEYDPDLIEIITVDGLSTDRTQSIINQYQKDYPNIKYFSNPDRKTPKALNIGIRNSKSEVVVILGAHTSIDKKFIYYNNKFLNQKNVDVCGGTQINAGMNYIQKAIGITMEVPFAMASAAYRWSKKEQYVDTVVYAAYKRKLFEKIGYFEEEFTISEDAELNWRIRQAGYKIFYSPKIKTYYYPRKSIFKFIKQMFRYGILRVNVLKKHIDSIKIVHLIPPIFVFSIIILTLLTLGDVTDDKLLIFFLLFYFCLSILFSIFTLSLKKIQFLPIVLLLTFLIHFFWGLGFIIGLILPRSDKW